MQRKEGTIEIDHELVDEIAWDVANQISSDTIVEKAKTLTVDEILQHRSVWDADATRHRHPHNGAMWGVAGGLFGLFLLILLLAITA